MLGWLVVVLHFFVLWHWCFPLTIKRCGDGIRLVIWWRNMVPCVLAPNIRLIREEPAFARSVTPRCDRQVVEGYLDPNGGFSSFTSCTDDVVLGILPFAIDVNMMFVGLFLLRLRGKRRIKKRGVSEGFGNAAAQLPESPLGLSQAATAYAPIVYAA